MILIEFCKKCGGLLEPKKLRKKKVLICRRCGRKFSLKNIKPLKLSVSSSKKPGKIVVVDKKSRFEALPMTTAMCPKCEHNKAYWWMQQTRAGDEAPTRFYKCVKCKHVWREYE